MKIEITTSPKHSRRNRFNHLLLILGLALAPIACSTSKTQGTDASAATHANLELNRGQKWVVHKPMMAHIRNLEQAVQDFEKKPGHDHAALANEIQENLGRLVTNCTMEGKAHDELHKWLMPFLGLSAEYTKATDQQVQQQKFQEIQHSLRVFNQYFE